MEIKNNLRKSVFIIFLFAIIIWFIHKISSNHWNEEIITDGDIISYYENGNISSKITLENDKPIGESFYYSKNGNIEKFQFYDQNSDLRFDCIYNEKERIIEFNGKSFYINVDKRNRYAKLNDTLFFYPILIYPPKYLNELKIILLYNHRRELVLNKVYSKSKLQPIYSHVIRDTSENTFLFVSNLLSSDSVIVSRDTILIDYKK